MKRGIITTAADIASDGPMVRIGNGLPPEKLRYYLLYWDKIALTDSNIFGSSLNSEQALLEQANVLSKHTAALTISGTFNGSQLTDKHFEGLAEVATSLTKSNPGQWAIHQSGSRLIIPHGLSTELVTADFELNRCLPVPTTDIPLDKVLDFKLRHADELIALRQSLDELYLEIARSADIPRAKIAQIQRLEKALIDLDKVTKLNWGQRLWASRKVSLDISLGAFSSGATSIATGDIILGLAVGAAHMLASSIKFCFTPYSTQLKEAVGKQIDLSYLASIKKEDITN